MVGSLQLVSVAPSEPNAREKGHLADAALAAVMECAPAFIIAVDCDGKIQFINRVLPQYSKQDVIGSSWLEYLPPDQHHELRERLSRIVSSGVSEDYETKVVGPAHETLFFSSHMAAMRREGEIVGAVLVSQDVTALKRAQLESAATQRLAAVGTLAAGVAHEINTPVQFVSDSITFLRDTSKDVGQLLDLLLTATRAEERQAFPPQLLQSLQAADELAKEIDVGYLRESVPEAFERCAEGLKRVTTIVRSMKEFAHPCGDAMVPVDLNRAIWVTLEVARSEYKYVADVQTDFGELPLVTCYGDQINQVVLNLIVNAAHAIAGAVAGTDTKGLIEVATRHDGEQVVITVADSGAGIDPAIAHRIFEPFFTTKEVGKGTGQGLALAWNVVKEKHGGEIGFASKAGGGTTFTVRLPIQGKTAS